MTSVVTPVLDRQRHATGPDAASGVSAITGAARTAYGRQVADWYLPRPLCVPLASQSLPSPLSSFREPQAWI